MLRPQESGRASARGKEQGTARNGGWRWVAHGEGSGRRSWRAVHRQSWEGTRTPACLRNCKKFRNACSRRAGAEGGEGADDGPWKTPKAIHAQEQLASFWGQQRATGEALSKRDTIKCTCKKKITQVHYSAPKLVDPRLRNNTLQPAPCRNKSWHWEQLKSSC